MFNRAVQHRKRLTEEMEKKQAEQLWTQKKSSASSLQRALHFQRLSMPNAHTRAPRQEYHVRGTEPPHRHHHLHHPHQHPHHLHHYRHPLLHRCRHRPLLHRHHLRHHRRRPLHHRHLHHLLCLPLKLVRRCAVDPDPAGTGPENSGGGDDAIGEREKECL